MKRIINLYKDCCITPLEAIQKFKKRNSKYKDIKIGYAGRLDPMAEGVLLLLIGGEENKNIEKYMQLDKEYVAEFLLNIKTDSYDLLGIAKKTKKKNIEDIKDKLRSIQGKYRQTLPYYSSYIVKGKPLFYYARRGKKIKVEREVNIKDIKIKNIRIINVRKLLDNIQNKIKKVKGDFRQDKILKRWQKELNNKNKEYTIIKAIIKCSKGTYIRSIANDMNALLYSLKRTKVGNYKVKDSLRR